MIDRAGYDAYQQATEKDMNKKPYRFRMSQEINITEVGISGGGETSESVVLNTALVVKEGEELMIVLARRIAKLEAQLIVAEELNDDQAHRLGKQEAENKALRSFTAHKPYCTWFHGFAAQKRVCDCELDDLLKQEQE